MDAQTISVRDQHQAERLFGECLDEGDLVGALAVRMAAYDVWGTTELCGPDVTNSLKLKVRTRIEELRLSGNFAEVDRLQQLMARP